MRNPSLLRRLPNPPRHFIHDHVVMRRIPTQQTAETNNGIVLPSLGQLPRRQRNLKRPRNPHQIKIFLLGTGAHQPVQRAQQKPLGDKRIEAGDNNRKAFTGSAQRSFDGGEARRGKRPHNEILLVFLLRGLVPPWVFRITQCSSLSSVVKTLTLTST
jgi:hypothetical protein